MKRFVVIGSALVVAAVAVLVLSMWRNHRAAPANATDERVAVSAILGSAETTGYARALGPHDFVFPADHGPHPGFRNEWWYFTGNLATAAGRRFGYQLTFFRIALAPAEMASPSAWRTRQIYLANFALTDAKANRFHAFEQSSRAALGLAGARAEPPKVWLQDWSAVALDAEGKRWHLHARRDGIAIDLDVQSHRPPVLQGDNGLSQKSAAPGNASYYYSLPRMQTTGTVRIGAELYAVKGLSWLDREWSTSALGPDQVGWDWFALQFDDGRALMFYQLRRRDGNTDRFSAGTLVDANGRVHRLTRDDVRIEVLDDWNSPASGVRYPSRWRLRVPSQAIDVEVSPLIAAQELRLSVDYWEGAVQFRGGAKGNEAAGRGYVELVGYAKRPTP